MPLFGLRESLLKFALKVSTYANFSVTTWDIDFKLEHNAHGHEAVREGTLD